jgi:mRNA-degrading endonuclease RelE of RelBE toxin-antitoxin system
MKILYSFRETRKFTEYLSKLLSDEDYSALQWELINNPAGGKIIKGSGGIRKIRWSAKGKGKRGGVRVIYYLAVRQDLILMLDIYAKNQKQDLSAFEVKLLNKLVAEWLQDG